ncbi:type II toxin-antitoxin system RelB/DinJ family antitoxin [Rhodobacter sphaeroides]|uniref:type II toxin-antitoxin system RelB/DinJ family antitoxin n=1 Tax=Cereibacter sphaeroides TaxID=1063 RepID=UPI00132C1CC4|nr:type II toxin-antitoxin system RelB/DinJ family antitoxin [Cereibacter sphaeroides]MWP40125.1 type II toxin-antitoxin system RelB/DinJ family antitoxin [Cereibacter sphaeroides]
MANHTSMLHVRVDDRLKAEAAEVLASVGLTTSDAVRVLLTRIVEERGLPVGLTVDRAAHDAWFRSKVHEVLSDGRAPDPRDGGMIDGVGNRAGKRG